jgi:hypothetical protein
MPTAVYELAQYPLDTIFTSSLFTGKLTPFYKEGNDK